MARQWAEIDREIIRGKSGFHGLDPYATWSLSEIGKRYLFVGEPFEFQVLLELQDPTQISARDLADGSKIFGAGNDAHKRWQESVFIPRAYTDFPIPPPELANFKHVTAIVTDKFFGLLGDPASERLRDALARVTLSRPVPRQSMRVKLPGDRLLGLGKPSQSQAVDAEVVVGIIDDGIAIGHERFRNADGKTRIESVWLQDGEPPSAVLFDYGRELRKCGTDGIDDLLAASRHDGIVDEDEFYRRAGMVDFNRGRHNPITWRRAHGTHVLDLAAGAQPGTASKRPIICVQLPIATTADTSGATLAVKVIDGILHILLRSLELATKPPPVVINLSYGTIAGPHDGSSHLECAIDDIVELWEAAFHAKVRVVMAGGNSYLGRIHARISQSRFQAGGTHEVSLPWRILPDDRTPSYVEIWLPHRSVDEQSPVQLSVFTPDEEGNAVGEGSPIVDTSSKGYILKSGDNTLCQVSYEYASPPTGRGVFLIAVSPTALLEASGNRSVAPFGLWKLKLKDVSLQPGEHVDAWIQRDDTPYGFPMLGRQSYFDDPCYVRFDTAGREVDVDDGASVVRRDGSLNAIATGVKPVVIGGVLRKELRPARYSSAGPVDKMTGRPEPHRTGPEALSVSDDSLVRAGTLAAGARSGSVVTMNGTSVAAPLITWWIAQQLANGGDGDRTAVERLARDQRLPLPPDDLPVEREGAGRIVGLPRHHPLRVEPDEWSDAHLKRKDMSSDPAHRPPPVAQIQHSAGGMSPTVHPTNKGAWRRLWRWVAGGSAS